MNMKKTIINTAITLAISSSAVAFNTAQAGALATSVVQLTNFKIKHAGGLVVDVDEFDTLNFTSSADTSASFTGVGSTTDSVAPSPNFKTDLYSEAVSTAPSVLTPYVNNDFTPLSSGTGSPDGNFAIGDQLESGSPISGFYMNPATGEKVSATTQGAVAVTAGATLKNASYVSVEGTGGGSAASNNGLEAKFTFTKISGALEFNFDISAYLEAFLAPGEVAPSTASSSFSVVFSLKDQDDPFAGELILNNGTSTGGLTGLGGTFSQTGAANAPGSGIGGGFGPGAGVPFTDNFTLNTAALDATHTYQLSARIQTAADAAVVPEPSILALLGTGLLGLGFARKQRAK